MVNILLAEDDRNFATVLKSELEAEKHTVDLVHDGVSAVLNFIQKPYGVVLLDIKMPKLGGVDALKIMKRLNPLIPTITFSGRAGRPEIEESLECGAIKCLIKPFRIEDLKNCIKGCLVNSPASLLRAPGEEA